MQHQNWFAELHYTHTHCYGIQIQFYSFIHRRSSPDSRLFAHSSNEKAFRNNIIRIDRKAFFNNKQSISFAYHMSPLNLNIHHSEASLDNPIRDLLCLAILLSLLTLQPLWESDCKWSSRESLSSDLRICFYVLRTFFHFNTRSLPSSNILFGIHWNKCMPTVIWDESSRHTYHFSLMTLTYANWIFRVCP